MEELDADGLQHILNGTVEPPENFDAFRFFDEYAAFIESLHEAGIVHGDIAPRNVMVDRKTGKPRVIDFGRSKRLSLTGKKREELLGQDERDLEQVYEALEKHFNLA